MGSGRQRWTLAQVALRQAKLKLSSGARHNTSDAFAEASSEVSTPVSIHKVKADGFIDKRRSAAGTSTYNYCHALREPPLEAPEAQYGGSSPVTTTEPLQNFGQPSEECHGVRASNRTHRLSPHPDESLQTQEPTLIPSFSALGKVQYPSLSSQQPSLASTVSFGGREFRTSADTTQPFIRANSLLSPPTLRPGWSSQYNFQSDFQEAPSEVQEEQSNARTANRSARGDRDSIEQTRRPSDHQAERVPERLRKKAQNSKCEGKVDGVKMSSTPRAVTPLKPWTEKQRRQNYIMGTGANSRWWAITLAENRKAEEITFLCHSNQRAVSFNTRNRQVDSINGDVITSKQGFQLEVLPRKEGVGDSRKLAGGAKFYSFNSIRLLPIDADHGVDNESSSKIPNHLWSEGIPLGFFNQALEERNDLQSILHYKVDLVAPDYMENEPIKTLIVPSQAHYVIYGLTQVKHRLRPDSTIVFSQSGLGLMELVNKELFPDPKQRPNYIVAINSFGVAERSGTGFNAGDLDAYTAGLLEGVRDMPFSINVFNPGGRVMVAPVPHEEGYDQDHIKARRDAETRDVFNTFLGTSGMNSELIDHGEALTVRCIRTAIDSVQALCALHDCSLRGLVDDPERREQAEALLREASTVVSVYAPALNYEKLLGIFQKMVIRLPDRMPNIAQSVAGGRTSSIGFINGWIAERGRQLRGGQVLCPMNEHIIEQLHEKMLKRNYELQEIRDEKNKKAAAQRRAEMKEAEGARDAEENMEYMAKREDKEFEDAILEDEKKAKRKKERFKLKAANMPSFEKPAAPLQWGKGVPSSSDWSMAPEFKIGRSARER